MLQHQGTERAKTCRLEEQQIDKWRKAVESTTRISPSGCQVFWKWTLWRREKKKELLLDGACRKSVDMRVIRCNILPDSVDLYQKDGRDFKSIGESAMHCCRSFPIWMSYKGCKSCSNSDLRLSPCVRSNQDFSSVACGKLYHVKSEWFRWWNFAWACKCCPKVALLPCRMSVDPCRCQHSKNNRISVAAFYLHSCERACTHTNTCRSRWSIYGHYFRQPPTWKKILRRHDNTLTLGWFQSLIISSKLLLPFLIKCCFFTGINCLFVFFLYSANPGKLFLLKCRVPRSQ